MGLIVLVVDTRLPTLFPQVEALVKEGLQSKGVTIISEGKLDAKTISDKKLIDNHYYAIANKASLTKPADLNPPDVCFIGERTTQLVQPVACATQVTPSSMLLRVVEGGWQIRRQIVLSFFAALACVLIVGHIDVWLFSSEPPLVDQIA